MQGILPFSIENASRAARYASFRFSFEKVRKKERPAAGIQRVYAAAEVASAQPGSATFKKNAPEALDRKPVDVSSVNRKVEAPGFRL